MSRVKTLAQILSGVAIAAPPGILAASALGQGSAGAVSLDTPVASPASCGWIQAPTSPNPNSGSGFTSTLWYDTCNRTVKAQLNDPPNVTCQPSSNNGCDGAEVKRCSDGAILAETDIPAGQSSVTTGPVSDAGITTKAGRYATSVGDSPPYTGCY